MSRNWRAVGTSTRADARAYTGKPQPRIQLLCSIGTEITIMSFLTTNCASINAASF